MCLYACVWEKRGVKEGKAKERKGTLGTLGSRRKTKRQRDRQTGRQTEKQKEGKLRKEKVKA